MLKIETNIKEKKYWNESTIEESKPKRKPNIISIYSNNTMQKYLGMGGAITEASAHNLSKLPIKKQNELLKCYYGKDGLRYNLARISIGSNDFSLSRYDYSSNELLDDFSIKNDQQLIIPTIKRIMKLNDITFIASPWSPPKFMKTNKSLLKGSLAKEYYDTYVNYLNKFISSYKKHNIKIKYITIQNEPYAIQPWESCYFSLDEQKDFIYNHLTNKIKGSNILLWDHNKDNIAYIMDNLYKDDKKVKGIAFHNYTGGYYNNLSYIHQKYPNMLLIHTEGCCSFNKYNELKWISKAEYYLKDLISDLNNGLNAYIDWNILLNHKGGQRSIKERCAAPILLNKKENDFYLTPIYYYLGHINKYVDVNSNVLLTTNKTNLYVVSFKNNNKVITTILNPNRKKEKIQLTIDNCIYNDVINPHTIITYIK